MYLTSSWVYLPKNTAYGLRQAISVNYVHYMKHDGHSMIILWNMVAMVRSWQGHCMVSMLGQPGNCKLSFVQYVLLEILRLLRFRQKWPQIDARIIKNASRFWWSFEFCGFVFTGYFRKNKRSSTLFRGQFRKIDSDYKRYWNSRIPENLLFSKFNEKLSTKLFKRSTNIHQLYNSLLGSENLRKNSTQRASKWT